MVVARADGCQRAPPKTETRPRGGRVSARGLVCQGGARSMRKILGNLGTPWGTIRLLRVPKGGGGWAVPPPLRSLHQRRRSLLVAVWCAWALCLRSPWRPLVASGGYEPPAGDTVRTGGGRSGTVRVLFGRLPVRPYRFGRAGRRLGPAAVAANSLPVPFSARGNRREARSGGGTGRHTSIVSARRLAGFPCRPKRAGLHVGVAFGRFALPLAPPHDRCRGEGGAAATGGSRRPV